MKKILIVIVSVLASATPVLAHEIGMEHDHRVLIAIGVTVALSIIVLMFHVINNASPKDSDEK